MQAITPLTIDDFKDKAKVPVSKLEIYIDPAWINICDLAGENYLISANYSSGQKEQTYEPIAASFSAVIDNIDGLFHPQNNDSAYKDYFKVGRKIRFSTGFTKNSTDYLWQWFIGVISEIDVDNTTRQVMIQGFDYMQYLSEVKMKSPDNYWGTTVTKSVVAAQAEYSMPAACNGAYIAYLDGSAIYEGREWTYDRTNNEFVFLSDYVPTVGGTNNLVIYYFTDQIVENVVADILVSAGLYADQAAALAAMDYTATGVTIERMWFSSGTNSLSAIQKLCERVDYRFYFTYDGTPIFKPIVGVDRWENRVFTFTKNLIAEPDYFENIDEVKNVVRIEGEKYSEGDELFVLRNTGSILDGDAGKYSNTAFGYLALKSLTTGERNVAIGVEALYSIGGGTYNVGIGYQSLYSNIGFRNVAIGDRAAYSNTTGGANVAIGQQALQTNTTGDFNIAIGDVSLQDNTTGYRNVAIGSSALFKNTEGYDNLALGTNALWTNTTGYYNTALGANAGYSNVSGNENVFLGYKAGYYETGSQKLYIAVSDTTTPLIYGEFINKNLGINLKSFGGGQGCISIANAVAVPSSNPTGGGILYADGGAGKWRGSSGTITTFAAADPHCPICGKDFCFEWKNEKYGSLIICMWCLTEGFKKGIIKRG